MSKRLLTASSRSLSDTRSAEIRSTWSAWRLLGDGLCAIQLLAYAAKVHPARFILCGQQYVDSRIMLVNVAWQDHIGLGVAMLLDWAWHSNALGLGLASPDTNPTKSLS